ncbi:MAG: ABC transporter ATP-binding protein [Gammaproteobacteria bacterium SG8_47]|nr:MAG: ABC transporter ATP-binding protein [Gammaproteobacteria bacterium SG8_47]
MPIVSLRDVSYSLGGPALLEGVSFQIHPGERVCLMGRNGTGKSTLLRLVIGEAAPDSGEIIRAQNLRMAQLPQEVPPQTRGSVFHVVAAGIGTLATLIEHYHGLAHAVADGDSARMLELERCQHELELAGGWNLNRRVEAVISRLGLDPDAEMDALSGGTKRRVLLAQALVSEPDLLLLDEPTNHLDIDAITWLEEFLTGWSGTLLFVSHDRSFVHRLATRILELDRGQLADFPGDLATYLQRKEAMLESEARHNALFDKRLAQEEAWIRQGIKARRTRNEGRVRALEQMRQQRAARRMRQGLAKLHAQGAALTGKLVIEAEHVDVVLDTKIVIHAFNTTIMRGDKVGIIGPNGCGKTTLLRTLLGELTPTAGTVRHGTNLEVAYFDQYRAALDEDLSVQDVVGEGRDTVMINGKPRHVLSYLQDFLFEPGRARQPVRALSGGERNRLMLARMFSRPANVLVLDEPTNDLDVETLELLESLLVDFGGTVLLVSHDRTFLDNVVTSTLVFEGEGRVGEYVGGYNDWLRQRPAATAPAKTQPQGGRQEPTRSKPRKLSYKESRELETLPQAIEALEAERDALQALMGEAEFYQRDKAGIASSNERLAELTEQLEHAYARWETLESLKASG